MGKIINTIIGDLNEKREYRRNEARAKALSGEYAVAYKEIKNYIFCTSGIISIEPLKVLVDMLEEAAANGRHVLDITGPDVAAFADELVRGEKSYFEQQRKKLNNSMAGKLKKKDR
jgi:DNA-binding ferritin-like protein (Dps family)